MRDDARELAPAARALLVELLRVELDRLGDLVHVEVLVVVGVELLEERCAPREQPLEELLVLRARQEGLQLGDAQLPVARVPVGDAHDLGRLALDLERRARRARRARPRRAVRLVVAPRDRGRRADRRHLGLQGRRHAARSRGEKAGTHQATMGTHHVGADLVGTEIGLDSF